jgi:hypothetical protein
MTEFDGALQRRDAPHAAQLFIGFKGHALLENQRVTPFVLWSLEKAADQQNWPQIDAANDGNCLVFFVQLRIADGNLRTLHKLDHQGPKRHPRTPHILTPVTFFFFFFGVRNLRHLAKGISYTLETPLRLHSVQT